MTVAGEGRKKVDAMALPLHAEIKAQYHYNLRQRLQSIERLCSCGRNEEAQEVIDDLDMTVIDSVRDILEALRRKEGKRRTKKIEILEEMETAAQLQCVSGKGFKIDATAFANGKLKDEKDTIFKKQYEEVDNLFDHLNSNKLWAREDSSAFRHNLHKIKANDWQDTLNIQYGVKQ